MLKKVSNLRETAPTRAAPTRRGFSLLEVLVAGLAVSTAVLIAFTALTTAQSGRRKAERMQYATQELQNQLERLSIQKWEDLTPERLAKWNTLESPGDRIPGAQLSVSVSEVMQPRRARQLVAQWKWSEADQHKYPPLRLTTWIFAPKETP